MKVCLKPIVNCADGTWRAHINFFDKDVPCEPKWSEWFRSYTAFILHYAVIAQESLKVEFGPTKEEQQLCREFGAKIVARLGAVNENNAGNHI
ncbi:hypothetical protein D3C81_1374100 [compost metagenome]